jgi:ATP-dependent DNA helicase RecQ
LTGRDGDDIEMICDTEGSVDTAEVPGRNMDGKLQKTFGCTNFREGEVQVIQALLDKRNVAVYWATGQGKSLCYQIPSLHQN